MPQLFSITAQDKITQATFSPSHGALGTSIQMADSKHQPRELLYFPKGFSLDQAHIIQGGWPFLFPICGRLSRNGNVGQYLYEHTVYPMEIHGFTHQLKWDVLHYTDSTLTLEVTHNNKTLKQYPFAFRLTLHLEVSPNQLVCTAECTNLSDVCMPYYAGYHPYFYIDPNLYPKDQVTIDLQAEKRLIYNQELTDIIGTQQPLPTPMPINHPDVNESLSYHRSPQTTRLVFPDKSTIELSVEGEHQPNLFPYTQLYHIESEPFFCIEPWMGHPNALNTIHSTQALGPQQTDRSVMTLILKNK